MKFPILTQALEVDKVPQKFELSYIAINRDFIKWMTRMKPRKYTYLNSPNTEIALIGSTETIMVLETIEQIEKLCDVGVQLFKKVETNENA